MDPGLLELLQMFGEKLKHLNLSYYRGSCEGLVGVHLPQLETLMLGHCYQLTDAGLEGILQASGGQLKVLDLAATQLTGEGLDGLGLNFPKLNVLNVQGCDQLTPDGLVNLTNLPGDLGTHNLNLIVNCEH